MSVEKDRKVFCGGYTCGWRGGYSEVLVAENPFEKGESITACPNCREIESIVAACDEPDCWSGASCGTPTDNGYRWTCHAHRPDD